MNKKKTKKELEVKSDKVIKNSFLKNFRNSFFNIPFYQDLINGSLKKGIKYCLLLLLFLTLFEVFSFSAVLRVALNQSIPKAEEYIDSLSYENLTIADGKAQLNPNTPYSLKNDYFVFNADTTKETLDIPDGSDVVVLLSSTAIRIRQSEGEMVQDRQINFSDFQLKEPLVITKDTLKSWIGTAKKWYWPVTVVFFLFMLLLEILKKFILIVLVGVLGYYFTKIIRLGITFRGVFTILCYLITPYIVIQYILSYIGMGFGLNLLLFFLMFGLLAFALEKRSRIEIIEPK